MIHVSISEEIAKACPDLHVAVVECSVVNTVSDEQLWKEITEVETHIRTTCKLEDINKFPPIQATRQAYKRLGKDPNRYRPSAEALRRRILRELPLYKIDTLVDIINLLSIQSGYSIGGFDAGKIDGDLVLGVGREGEIYHGIGRGELNIAGLPVYRDNQGGRWYSRPAMKNEPMIDIEYGKAVNDYKRILRKRWPARGVDLWGVPINPICINN